MRRMVEKLMTQYGTDLTLCRGDTQKTVRGFFRAISSNSYQSMTDSATPLGFLSQGQYTYIGPVAGDVRKGDILLLGQKPYHVRRVEDYHYGNDVLYQWALCVAKDVNDTWGI